MGTYDFQELAVFRLGKGAHPNPHAGLCAMEAVAWLEGLEHSDTPPCTCPTIAEFVRNLNDSINSEDRQRLIKYLPRLVGTVSEWHERARAKLLVDMVGQRTPINAGFWHIAVQRVNEAKCVSAAFNAACALFSNKELVSANVDYGFAILDAVLAIGPQSPGFSKNTNERVAAYRALAAETQAA